MSQNRPSSHHGHPTSQTKAFTVFILGVGLTSLFVYYDCLRKEIIAASTNNKYVALLKRSEIQVEAKVVPAVGGVGNGSVAKPIKKVPLRPNRPKPRSSIRILCWVMTSSDYHKTKAWNVKKTWGRRCNKLIFISSENDEELGALKLTNVTKTDSQDFGDGLWPMTQAAFRHVWKYHQNDADWFLKAHDDTYVILENLRLILSRQNPRHSIYFGCQFKPLEKEYKNGYMSGGPSYVLSNEAVRRFAELPDDHKCFGTPDGNEDYEMGKCLEDARVAPRDSRDEQERHRFIQLAPEMLIGRAEASPIRANSWYSSFMVHPQEEGDECCSNTAISFHYMGGKDMWLMEYLVYRLKPFGFPSKSLLYSPYN